MSKDKQTFIDPETREKVESTKLVQWGSMLAIGVACGVGCGLICGLLIEVFDGLEHRLLNRLTIGLIVGLGSALVAGLYVGVLSLLGYTGVLPNIEEAQGNDVTRWAHDGIACFQHRRRHRVLRSQEHQDVPDTAISRAIPLGEPEPTDAALSVADTTDGTDHLTSDVETEDAETVVETEYTV